MVLKCFDATPLFGLFPQNYEVFYLTNDTYSPANKDSFYIEKVEKKKTKTRSPVYTSISNLSLSIQCFCLIYQVKSVESHVGLSF